MIVDPVTLIEQGYHARRERRLGEARQHFADAVELCHKGDDPVLLAQALTGLGQIERDLDHLDSALQHYAEAADLYRDLDRPLALAHTVRHVADILRNQVQLGLAAPHYREALAIYRGHAQTPSLDLANAVRGYALLKEDSGETEEAMELWREAGRLYATVDVQAGVAEAEAQIVHLTLR